MGSSSGRRQSDLTQLLDEHATGPVEGEEPVEWRTGGTMVTKSESWSDPGEGLERVRVQPRHNVPMGMNGRCLRA
jgi:hypothetical protein